MPAYWSHICQSSFKSIMTASVFMMVLRADGMQHHGRIHIVVKNLLIPVHLICIQGAIQEEMFVPLAEILHSQTCCSFLNWSNDTLCWSHLCTVFHCRQSECRWSVDSSATHMMIGVAHLENSHWKRVSNCCCSYYFHHRDAAENNIFRVKALHTHSSSNVSKKLGNVYMKCFTLTM